MCDFLLLVRLPLLLHLLEVNILVRWVVVITTTLEIFSGTPGINRLGLSNGVE